MKKINLSEEDKKILNKYNYFLMAVVGEDGLTGYAYVSEDEGVYDFNGLYPKGHNGYNRQDEIETEGEGYNLLFNLVDNFLDENSYSFTDYLYCDDCTGYGNVNIDYNPFNSTLKITLDITVRGSEDYTNVFSFEQLKNQPQGQWGQRYEELKKLGDAEFIEKMKKEYGNTLVLNYDGGGDSGQIYDDGETSNGVVKIGRDIEYVGYEVIDIYYGGWENNEGAEGRIIFNFEKEKVELYHTFFIEDYESEEIGEFKLM
jgi:hypothetical protein